MWKIENNPRKRFGYFLSMILISSLLVPAAGFANTSATNLPASDIGALLPIWSVLPFAGILLSIALIPLFAPHFWEHHFPKVSAFWALVLALPFLFFFKGVAVYEIVHIFIVDYIPFIILLWALFAVSGGIYIKGTLKGTPPVNIIMLLIGTI